MGLLGHVRQESGDPEHKNRQGAVEDERRHAPALLLARLPSSVKSTKPREACPCCGFATLKERAKQEICPVCWWQDDGQDSKDADEVWGGPNDDLSLTQGRKNFVRFGTAQPSRKDLEPKSPSLYRRLRVFRLEGEKIIESGL